MISSTRVRTVVAGLVLGAAVMVVGSTTWLHATTSSAVEPTVELSITGSVLAPAVNAGGLVVLAAACALALGGIWGRRLAAGGVVIGGVLAAVSGAAGIADPRAAALSAARETVGVAVLDGPVATTPMPWAAVVLGLLAVALGARTAWVTGRWAAPSARHDVAPATDGGQALAGAATSSDPVDPYDAWDSLSRGHDPT